MHLVQRLVLLCLCTHIVFVAKFVPGLDNGIYCTCPVSFPGEQVPAAHAICKHQDRSIPGVNERHDLDSM